MSKQYLLMPRQKVEKPSKKVVVTIPAWLWGIVETDLKDRIGESDSEKVKTMVVAFLSEQGYFLNKGVKA